MKVIFFVFVVIFALVFTGCRKDEIILPSVITPLKTSERMFVRSLAYDPDIKKLPQGYCFTTGIDTSRVATSATFFTVHRIQDSCSYGSLKNLLEMTNLNCVWIAPQSGTHLEIKDYYSFLLNNEWYERFLIIEPKPAMYVEIGDTIYWLKSTGEFWNEKGVGLIFK